MSAVHAPPRPATLRRQYAIDDVGLSRACRSFCNLIALPENKTADSAPYILPWGYA